MLSTWGAFLCALATSLSACQGVAGETRGQTETIRVELKLRTGGALTGLVVDATDHGIVVVAQDTPFVFAWTEIETGAAFVAKRDLLALKRGGVEELSAADHFQLGQFALSRERNSLAATEFREASRLDPEYEAPAQDAFAEFRRQRQSAKSRANPIEQNTERDAGEVGLERGLAEEIGRAFPAMEGSGAATRTVGTNAEIRARAMEVYKEFGQRVRERVYKKLALIETDHFLIWTDWGRLDRGLLAEWCESMYAALCKQFDFEPSQSVFLAKCPVFCWRSKARFWRFARQFDGYEGKDAIGYSRSIAENGHVHLVLLRDGRTEYDYDRFASTLVHEGTHAFLHRLHTTRLIPHWVNEGYADLMAERILGDRCPNAENASLLARQYAKYNWPAGDMLGYSGPIPVHEYALAHSVVAHLESAGEQRFAEFIRRLKDGDALNQALTASYEGLTLTDLEQRWRESIRPGIQP